MILRIAVVIALSGLVLGCTKPMPVEEGTRTSPTPNEEGQDSPTPA